MKKLFIIFIALSCLSSTYSQDFKMSNFYAQRELKAPQAVKDRLALLRKDIAVKNLKYTVGYTSVAEAPIEKITGFREPTSTERIKIMERYKPGAVRSATATDIVTKVKIEGELPWPGNPYVFGNPSQSRLDLREAGFITPVRDQGLWGSCWAFSAMAAYESSYKILTKKEINTSEEYVVNCSGAGDWGGGWMWPVYIWMVDNQYNVSDETELPYTGPPVKCPSVSPNAKYFAANWGFADPAVAIPTVAKIKEAICKYGALSCAVSVTEGFKLYVGGIFNYPSSASPDLNHAVTIIGWDDSTQCWLIKNSWGTGWGSECGYGTERGYMWIKYNSSNVGAYSSWVRASTIIHN